MNRILIHLDCARTRKERIRKDVKDRCQPLIDIINGEADFFAVFVTEEGQPIVSLCAEEWFNGFDLNSAPEVFLAQRLRDLCAHLSNAVTQLEGRAQ